MAEKYVASTGNDTTGDGSAGNPWRTLQKGLNTTVRPGTIYVPDDDVLLTQPFFGHVGAGLLTVRPVTLRDNYAYGFTVQGVDDDIVMGACSNVTFKNARFLNNAEGAGNLTMNVDTVDFAAVTFEDSTFESSDDTCRHLFKISGDCTFNRCTSKNADGAGSAQPGFAIMGLPAGLILTIKDCRFDNPHHRSATLWGVITSLTFTGNTNCVSGAANAHVGTGFRIGDWAANNTVIGRLVCTDNVFDGAVAESARTYFYHIDNALIRNNTFRNSGDVVSIDQCLGVDFGYNTVQATQDTGSAMLLAANKYMRVHHNKILVDTPTTGTDAIWIHGTNFEHAPDPGDWRHTKNLDFAFHDNYVKIRNANAFLYSNDTLANTFDTAGQVFFDRNCFDWAGAAGRNNNFFTTVTALTLAAMRARWVAEGFPLYDGTNSINDRNSVTQSAFPNWDLGANAVRRRTKRLIF